MPDLFYVPQGAFAVARSGMADGPELLYADGATSCIVALVTGQDAAGTPTVLLTHLDTPEATRHLFEVVLGSVFVGPIILTARGASPPDLPWSKVSVAVLVLSVAGSGDQAWQIERAELQLGEQSPGGWLGFDLRSMELLANSIPLDPGDRDPRGGPSALMAMNRSSLRPPIPLWDATQPVPTEMVDALVTITAEMTARPDEPDTSFLEVENQDDARVLDLWSTTPDHEPPWFCEQLRQAARFTTGWLSERPASAPPATTPPGSS